MADASTSKRTLLHKRDFWAGILMILFGLVAATVGPSYRVGSLMHMQPGFMPTALGVLLVLLGIAIAGPTVAGSEGDDGNLLPDNPQWVGWACILGSPLAFILFGEWGGMIPGTFACVFVAALGDRSTTWKGAAILGAIITLFGVTLFHHFLQVPMPIWKWGIIL
jgi:hypothetical protein